MALLGRYGACRFESDCAPCGDTMVSDRQKEARRYDSDRMKVCGHCGVEYESYMLPVTEDVEALQEWQTRKQDYGNLCQDCNEAYFVEPLGLGKRGEH